jgi:hypothetical protein
MSYNERVYVWNSRQEQKVRVYKSPVSFDVPFLGNRLVSSSFFVVSQGLLRRAVTAGGFSLKILIPPEFIGLLVHKINIPFYVKERLKVNICLCRYAVSGYHSNEVSSA